MNMVEKVARAIYRCDGAVYGTDERMFDPYPFDELDEIQVAGLMDRARAAIEAMRECDNSMLEAMHSAMFTDVFDGSSLPMLGSGFEAAIDAALTE